MKNIKEPVKLRDRKRKDGVESLFLDYTVDGQRINEYLKLYVLPGTTKAIKAKNAETYALANAVKAKRIVEYQNGRLGFDKNKGKSDVLLLDWVQKQREIYLNRNSKRVAATVYNLTVHLINYKGKEIRLKNVNKSYISDFITFLNTTKGKYGEKLAKGTIYHYYIMLSIILNKAVKSGIINKNPCTEIDSFDKPQRTSKVMIYLTFDEVRKLSETDCDDWRVKHSFLFCCFCGLRWIDVSNLKWGDIKEMDNGKKQIELIQQKTKEPVYIPLSNNALTWLPDKGINGNANKVFPFGDRSIIYDYLHKWVEAAGIKKKVTFHSSRHTYATMLLTYGADIYTVSKLLGHTSVKTTEIYAKVVDSKKSQAVELIPDI